MTTLPQQVSINVAIQSILDSAFRLELQHLLKANAGCARRMVF
jgi:hypothetical protein